MEIVASKFERDGLIDYKEFVNSLKDKKPVSANFIQLVMCLKGQCHEGIITSSEFVTSSGV